MYAQQGRGPGSPALAGTAALFPLQESCEPACLLTQSNEAGTNGYPL